MDQCNGTLAEWVLAKYPSAREESGESNVSYISTPKQADIAMDVAHIPSSSRLCRDRAGKTDGNRVSANGEDFNLSNGGSSDLNQAMLVCQKQRSLWSIKRETFVRRNELISHTVFERYNLCGTDFRDIQIRSCMLTDSDVLRFFRDSETFRRIIMQISIGNPEDKSPYMSQQ